MILLKKLFRFTAVLILLCIAVNVFSLYSHAEPGVSAASAVLMERSSRHVLLDVNARTRMPMASTTKIMTALTALENCDELSRVIHIPKEAVGIEGSSIYLKTGEPLTMEQLLYALLLESANDAAAAIAIAIAGDIPAFADLMNKTAARLGLTDTHFTNPHGLDDEDHYTTAYDLALLACCAMDNPDFARIAGTYKVTIPLNGDEGTRVLINHNKLLKSYSGASGVKTGYTKRCGRCLVSAAERDGVSMIAVTLNAPDDWRDHTAMLDYGFSLYESVPLAQVGEFRYEIPVLGGTAGSVWLTNTESLSVTLPRSHGEISVTAEANHYLCAPVCAGDMHGTLIFRCDGKILGTLPLLAENGSEAIPTKTSAADRLKEMLRIP